MSRHYHCVTDGSFGETYMLTYHREALFFAVFTTLALGCTGDSHTVDSGPVDSIDEIVDNLRAAGYPDSEIEIRDDGAVLVGGDAVVTLAASSEMITADAEDDLAFRQYRTGGLIFPSMGLICIDGSALSGTLSDALDAAIANYTDLWLTFDMVRISGSTVGCDATIIASVVGGSTAESGFPSGGLPFPTIKIGTDVASQLGVATHDITHQLGHCIGLRHSDYYDRAISCGGSAGGEVPDVWGTVHIPYTPVDATYNGSVMNTCHNPGSTGVFTPSDITALKRLYGVAYGAGVASFAGTLDIANIDGSGHFIVGVADVTGDDRADLVSVHTNGSAYVWPGRANATFGSAVASFAGTLDLANIDGSGHFIVDVADVTGDGRADLVSAHTGGTAYVWPGRANGTFGSAVASFDGTLDLANIDGTGHHIVDVADVTGDGRADLVSTHTGGTAYVWLGRANGTFGSAVASFDGTLDLAYPDGNGHFIVDVADVNGDGRADLVSGHTGGTAHVWQGKANGTFGSVITSFSGFPVNFSNVDGSGHFLLAAADVDRDGRADLVSTHPDGTVRTWPGQMQGRFSDFWTESFTGTLDTKNNFLLDVADVTGDGRADLVSAHTNHTAYVWPGHP